MLIALAVIGGLAAVTLVAYIAWRVHRSRHPGAARTEALPPGAARAAQPLPPPQQPALPSADGQVHIHHHWHGVTAEDVAAIIEHRRRTDGQA